MKIRTTLLVTSLNALILAGCGDSDNSPSSGDVENGGEAGESSGGSSADGGSNSGQGGTKTGSGALELRAGRHQDRIGWLGRWR